MVSLGPAQGIGYRGLRLRTDRRYHRGGPDLQPLRHRRNDPAHRGRALPLRCGPHPLAVEIAAVMEELGRRGRTAKAFRSRRGKQHGPAASCVIAAIVTCQAVLALANWSQQRTPGPQARFTRLLWRALTGNIVSYSVGPRARPAEVATPRNRGLGRGAGLVPRPTRCRGPTPE
jgi:hypothetical protein